MPFKDEGNEEQLHCGVYKKKKKKRKEKRNIKLYILF